MKECKTPLYLAPMAGAGDRAFREICGRFGVDFFCTEMISAKAYHFGDKKTIALAETGQAERPIAIQLFGSEPEILAEAAKGLGTKDRADWIDLNFGCPVPKIVNNGEGSALMRDPDRIYEIACAVCEASSLPVSVKIRAGWDGEHINAPEIAALCEKAGAARIAVHGRCRADFYRDGTVRPDVIRRVKEAVSIPVIGNGDVRDGQSALRMLEETGCDGLMIGRGAVGAPWVFAEIRAALEGKPAPEIDRREAIREHLRLAFCYKPKTAGREMRMHMAQYLKGFRGAARLRDRASHAETLADYEALIAELAE
jgi:nifR3 family TIM-barrel protein